MDIKKIIKYIFAGSIATLSNLLVLFIFVHYLQVWYLLSASISFIFGVGISYLLQKYFVFKNSNRNISKQFIHFFVYNLFMLILNGFFMYIFVDIFNVWYLLSQAITAMITAFINFVYFNRVIFKTI
jgi:putative flippase GtrA